MVNLRFDIFFNAKGATLKEQRAGVRQEKKETFAVFACFAFRSLAHWELP
jgi:hypothetical protein